MSEPVPIQLQPGLYDIGTDYEGMGRWVDGDRVRFERNSPRPIGGWERRLTLASGEIPPIFADPATEVARNGIAWQGFDLSQHLVFGTNLGLYYVSEGGVVRNITPVDFPGGSAEPSQLQGYGIGPFGIQAYGTRRTGQGLPVRVVASWSFSLWGDILMAQFREKGPIYNFEPHLDAKAVPISAAPKDGAAILVTDQRMLMTLIPDGRSVVWCDSENFTDWAPTVTNTAGSYTLSGEGALSAMGKVGQDILILSTVDAWVGRFIKAPYIYGFDRVGQNVGTAAPNSLIISSRRAFWMGMDGTFYTYAQGGAVEVLPCDIFDRVRQQLSFPNISKTYGFENPRFKEVVWLVQTVDSSTGDASAYIAYSLETGQWTYGVLRRTTAIAGSVNRNPIMVNRDGELFNHELDGVYPSEGDMGPPRLSSGPLQFGQGGQKLGVQFLFPDAEPAGPAGVDLTFHAKDMPQDAAVRDYGPYTFNGDARPISTTGLQGRQLSLSVRFNAGRSKFGILRMLPVTVGGR